MPTKTLDIDGMLMPDNVARQISDTYTKWKNARARKEADWLEVRNYIFATDTTTTTNSKLPWKNKTTRPKLCQIRDNLHANYMAALFPNENWFKWQAATEESADKDRSKVIQAFMAHKFRESKFKERVSRLVLDYIDYGNAIGDVEFVNEVSSTETGGQVPVYVGPRLVRISPHDIVFDLTAPSFEQSPKITRSLLSFGQIEKLRRTNPEWGKLGEETFARIRKNRLSIGQEVKSLESADHAKLQGYIADGFNSLLEYYTSGMVEFIEFEGDFYDGNTGTLYENHVITVVDRAYVIRQAPIQNWFARSHKQHVGWRLRPDNLYAMGPLDNLVGLQYRIDHLENLKADVFDMIAFPLLKIKGYVEEFQYGPYEKVFMEQDADVEPIAPDTTALNADLEIARLEQTMEEMAGAPKQAMGVRTPGEKTAFEVQELMNAASRIFQNKISYFEEHFLEPLMNSMLEVARRNIQSNEVIRIIDDEQGVTEFLEVTADHLKAKGKLVPMGARHFAAQSQLVQNLANLSSTGLYQDPAVISHLSGKKIAQLLEENLNLERFGIYRPNVRLEEQLESQNLAMQGEEELGVNAMTPTEETTEIVDEPAEEPEA